MNRLLTLEVHREWTYLFDSVEREPIVQVVDGREYRGPDAERFHLRSQGLIVPAIDMLMRNRSEVA